MRANKKIHDRRKWKKFFLSFSLKLIKNNQTTYKVFWQFSWGEAQLSLSAETRRLATMTHPFVSRCSSTRSLVQREPYGSPL